MSIKYEKRKKLTLDDVNGLRYTPSNFDLKMKASYNTRLEREILEPSNKKVIDNLRKSYERTKGWSGKKVHRHIAEVPAIVMNAAKRQYGERILKDAKLFRKLFEPWLVVPSSTIGGTPWRR